MRLITIGRIGAYKFALGNCLTNANRVIVNYEFTILPTEGGIFAFFFFSSRRRHTISLCDWSSDVCSSDLPRPSAGTGRSAASGDEARWRGRHFDRSLRMAEGFRDNFASDEQMERYHALHDEHANIQAALVYMLDTPEGDRDVVQAGARLVSALAMYWMISGLMREGGY